MNNEVLKNVQANDSIVLAQFASAKRFKMKPETYNATMNAKQKLESLQESEIQKQFEQEENQALMSNEVKSSIDSKMVKLDEKNVGLKEFSEALYNKTGNRPIRIKQSMITNIVSNYSDFENQNIDVNNTDVSLKDIERQEMREFLNNPSVMKVDVVNKTGYSLEEIQNQQIQELLRNSTFIKNEQPVEQPGYSLEEIQNQQIVELLNKKQEPKVIGYSLEEIQNQQIQELLRNPQKFQETKNETLSILGYTLEEIQNQEIEKLLNKEGIKQTSKPVIPGYSLEEIQNQEIQKMLERNSQIRDEIQIVPDRFIGLKETIDNEFANQENVQQISREEVEKTINAGKEQSVVEESQTPSIDKEEMARRVQQSIAEALRKLDEKQQQKEEKPSKLNLKMPIITFADIFKSAKEQKKENDFNMKEQLSDYEISESIREQIRSKLSEQKAHKPVVTFSNEEEDENDEMKVIDFQSYKDKISEKIRKNNELKAIREQLQRNTEEKANKVQLAQARRKEAEAKFEEYLQKLDEQANCYNNEITQYQNQENQYSNQIDLLEEETNMLYGMLGYQD